MRMSEIRRTLIAANKWTGMTSRRSNSMTNRLSLVRTLSRWKAG